jgi:hypothetical protein
MEMVEAMDWLIFVLMIAVPVLLLRRRRGKPGADRTSYQVIVSLYAIRRRLEVTQVKTELRRDAARLRREMRDELHKLDERGRL